MEHKEAEKKIKELAQQERDGKIYTYTGYWVQYDTRGMTKHDRDIVEAIETSIYDYTKSLVEQVVMPTKTIKEAILVLKEAERKYQYAFGSKIMNTLVNSLEEAAPYTYEKTEEEETEEEYQQDAKATLLIAYLEGKGYHSSH